MSAPTENPAKVARRYVETYNKGTEEYIETCATEDIVGVRFPGGKVIVEGRGARRRAMYSARYRIGP